jgi:hypothetical protein
MFLLHLIICENKINDVYTTLLFVILKRKKIMDFYIEQKFLSSFSQTSNIVTGNKMIC